MRATIPALSLIATAIGAIALSFDRITSEPRETAVAAQASVLLEPPPPDEAIHSLGLPEVSLATLAESGQFVLMAADMSHVIVIPCGTAKFFNTSGKAGYGSGPTEEAAMNAALANLHKNLWPSDSHTCAECGIPDLCKKVIGYPDGSSPKVEFYEVLPPPPYPVFYAKATYSGNYSAGCTPCE